MLDHVALVETSVLKACRRQLAVAREAGLAAETETSAISPTLPVEQVASRERTINAPERLMPRGFDEASAWAEIESVRGQFREFVLSCDGLALGQVSFSHPTLGPLNLYQWLLFAAGHHARHAAQIREIGRQLA